MNQYIIYKYIKLDTNEVVYIGRTNNLVRRRVEHEKYEPYEKGRPHYNYPLSRGIRKYGVDNYKCEIVEKDLTYEESLEREQYWIAYYDTYSNPSKYNYTPGGDLTFTTCKFNQEIINYTYKLLQENTPFKIINELTGISIPHISEINTGKRWHNEKIKYPIMTQTCGRKLNKNQIKEIINLLQTTQCTIQQISQQYNVTETVIQRINSGKSYHQNDIIYPIRKRITSHKNHTLNQSELMLLINDLQNSNLTFNNIANKYGVSTSTIYNINAGRTRKQKNLNYPLRK